MTEHQRRHAAEVTRANRALEAAILRSMIRRGLPWACARLSFGTVYLIASDRSAAP